MSMLSATEWMLVCVCFFGSLISVSVGTSCGLLFAAMVSVLPPSVALPLHGLVEGLSSGIRWAVLRRYVNYRYLVGFMVGGSMGFLLGWPLLGLFTDQQLTLLLGVFLLITLWFPLGWLKLTAAFGGMSTSCLTVLVGATGPLVAALLARSEANHRTVVSTQGACTVFQHWGKVLVFTLYGFSFVPYINLVIALIISTVVGTLFGRKLLNIIPAFYLRTALQAAVSLLGVRLVLTGLNVQVDEMPIQSVPGVLLIMSLVLASCYFGYKIGRYNKQ